ncbi:hypothetical protein [Paenibacillus methanolicus]|uniref:Uncharacterized protein n=1 Tax=Paenibacillus methanolicus TaxID=582686 RepID=A0A5S5CJD0_9BACL|nr:hypothetical protein [Paenibacillus methanolicus]TYP78123.1 hypothetical protein BCM02_102700 [Paenibacillus methanolicus]
MSEQEKREQSSDEALLSDLEQELTVDEQQDVQGGEVTVTGTRPIVKKVKINP